jgi:hypothetical protein
MVGLCGARPGIAPLRIATRFAASLARAESSGEREIREKQTGEAFQGVGSLSDRVSFISSPFPTLFSLYFASTSSAESSAIRPMTCFYQELADWWPLFSTPADYALEADELVASLALGPRAHSHAARARLGRRNPPRTSRIASR